MPKVLLHADYLTKDNFKDLGESCSYELTTEKLYSYLDFNSVVSTVLQVNSSHFVLVIPELPYIATWAIWQAMYLPVRTAQRGVFS